MSLKVWRFSETNKERAKAMAKQLALDEFLVLLLTVRGYDSAEKISAFLEEGGAFSDPFSLKDMDKAVARIQQAMDAFESIAVFGDYDADGISATALLYSYLETCGANVMFYIPERQGEGYGISRAALDTLAERGVSLIVTVDNGISAVKEIEYANSLGLDVVVTDHHQPGEILPDACAVVDPHRWDCPSSCKNLAGVGVAFKLICAMEGPEGAQDTGLDNYSELVAIGTVADIVPLTGENRALVKYGLRQMAHTDRPGLRALVEEAGLDSKRMTAGNIAFGLAPRMNAAGRMGSPLQSVKLLLSEEPEEAKSLARELGEENHRRQATEQEILEQVQTFFSDNPERLLDRVLVVDGEGFHQGVIGIVAARLLERFGKPVIVIAREEELLKGSGRSLPGFSLHEALTACSDLMIKFGGHEQAAGFSMDGSNLEIFRKRINEYAAGREMPKPALSIDLKLNPAGLSTQIVEQIASLEPFGCGNPAPLFALTGMELVNIYPVGGGKHLRLTVSREDASVTVMRFSTRPDEFPYRVGDVLDLAVTLDASVYRGQEQLSVYVREIRFAEEDTEKMLRERAVYEAFRREEPMAAAEARQLLPSREDHAALYRFLREEKCWRFGTEVLYHRLAADIQGYGRLLTALSILEEKGLIVREGAGKIEQIAVTPTGNKVDLESGELYVRLKKAMG